ncbi:hypothetical protein NMG60_11009115 [Bertholletia excelsa]
MEFFCKTKAVKLRSHHDKYLIAGDDHQTVRQSRHGASRKARWLVELVDGDPVFLRLKSCYGLYLATSESPFLLGMTGKKVIQAKTDNSDRETAGPALEWEPIRDGFQVRLRAASGTYLRANGGTPPWRNMVTHDREVRLQGGSIRNWVLWDVEAVEVPENEELSDYLSLISSFSSLSDELCSELGSPSSIHSLELPSNPALRRCPRATAMDLFQNAKAVRLRSHHDKYLHADEDEESVLQVRDGSSRNARWSIELVDGSETVLRLKSCYGKYLTASNAPFLLGMTGRKVIQTLPSGRLDSSLEWEPIREGNCVKLRTRYGHFLRANGGVPPWRNSVTHDIPHRTATQDWILWDVHIVEIIPTLRTRNLLSPSTHSTKSPSFGRQESSDSLGGSPSKTADGRIIYYHIADEYGNSNEDVEGLCISFRGNDVDELTRRLEEVTGLSDIVVCARSPLNGKLYPLRLQLPPNNVTMHVVVVESSSKVARDFVRSGIA